MRKVDGSVAFFLLVDWTWVVGGACSVDAINFSESCSKAAGRTHLLNYHCRPSDCQTPLRLQGQPDTPEATGTARHP